METETLTEHRTYTWNMSLPVMPNSGSRYGQLDGLRGLAALVVFVFHAAMIAPPDSAAIRVLLHPILRPLWDGPGAVMLFFVLSGFVLTLPFTGGARRANQPIPFVIRRIARLYPAYWAVLLVGFALRAFAFNAHGLSGLSPWAAMHWSKPIAWTSLVSHVFMVFPGLRVDDIDPVIWSLIIEMKVSLLFPILIWLVTRTKQVTNAILALLLTVTLSIPLHLFNHSSSSWPRAIIMMPMFLLGSYLAWYRNQAVSALKASRLLQSMFAATGAALYGAVWIMPASVQSLGRIGCACGSGAFILLFMASPRLQRIGTAPVMSFLGKVSYSFYLIHLPILITLTSLLYPRTHSLLVAYGLSLACSLAAAWALYVTVEMPAHTWGKRLATSVTVASRRERAVSLLS